VYGFLLVFFSKLSLKCTIFLDIWLQKCRDLENRVRGPSRSLEMSQFDRAHVTSYWRSTVNVALSRVVSEIFNVEKYRDLDIGSEVTQGHRKWYHSIRHPWLPDGWKSFKIGLAVLIQYWRVTADSQPASHVAVAYTALTTSCGYKYLVVVCNTVRAHVGYPEIWAVGASLQSCLSLLKDARPSPTEFVRFMSITMGCGQSVLRGSRPCGQHCWPSWLKALSLPSSRSESYTINLH